MATISVASQFAPAYMESRFSGTSILVRGVGSGDETSFYQLESILVILGSDEWIDE